MANEQPTAAIPLSKGKKILVQLGAICLTVSIACYGLALTLFMVKPLLEKQEKEAAAKA